MMISELQALTDGQKTDLIGLMKELAPDIEVNAEVLEHVVESPGTHLFAALDNEGHIVVKDVCLSGCFFDFGNSDYYSQGRMSCMCAVSFLASDQGQKEGDGDLVHLLWHSHGECSAVGGEVDGAATGGSRIV